MNTLLFYQLYLKSKLTLQIALTCLEGRCTQEGKAGRVCFLQDLGQMQQGRLSKPVLLPGRMQPGSPRQPQPLAQCSSTASVFPPLLLLQEETAKAEGGVGLVDGEGDSKVWSQLPVHGGDTRR